MTQRVVIEGVGVAQQRVGVGIPGIQGPPGKSVDPAEHSHRHVQSVPAAEWEITHSLSFRPSVTITDSTGRVVYGAVSYPSDEIVIVEFSAAFAGEAYLS